MSALRGNQESAFSVKQKDSVQKEMLAASATMTVAGKANAIVRSCSKAADTKSQKKTVEREVSQRQ